MVLPSDSQSLCKRYLIAGTKVKVNLSLELKVVVDPEGAVTYILSLFCGVCVNMC